MLKRLGAQVVLTEPQPLKDPVTGFFFSFFSPFFFKRQGLREEGMKNPFSLTPLFKSEASAD